MLKSGVKVAPLPLENAILKELPIADAAVVVGEGHEYLTCLITLKVCDQLSHEILKLIIIILLRYRR